MYPVGYGKASFASQITDTLVLVIFLVIVTKHMTRSNLRLERFISVHSLRGHSQYRRSWEKLITMVDKNKTASNRRRDPE